MFKDRNAMGGLGSFSTWMWWETIVEGVKDSAATGKRLRRDNMRSSMAVGSNPWERWKGRRGRWTSRVVKFFFRHQSLTYHNKCMLRVGGHRL